MVRLQTLRELFTYNDWANGRLLACAGSRDDAALDEPFEMGEGSLRRTLNHLCAAECVWLDRWLRKDQPRYRADATGMGIFRLRDDFGATAADRNALLARIDDNDLCQPLAYRNTKGEAFSFPLGPQMLHVCNHGVHHRAQAQNMLKRLGVDVPKPGLDYIFMKLGQTDGGTRDATPPELDLDTLRAYFRYADWARNQTHCAALKLNDAALDREFPIGLGTLRKTLLHIRFAEQWWLENWLHGPGRPFPELGERTGIADLDALFDQTARERNAYLDSRTDADLTRFVEARPRPDVVRAYPLGVTLLQLCCHGVHHRAQALNMLRHVGGDVPGLDVIAMLRSQQDGVL